MCWMHGCAFESVCTANFGITYTNCHLQGIKQALACVSVFKTRKLQIHPPLNIFTIPDWRKC